MLRRMVIIRAWQNGPYLVEGDDVTVVDWKGNAYPIPSRPFALCRCGGSATKPFCDGTHSTGCRQVAESQRQCGGADESVAARAL
jgi:CDGSH-type Zn-finger protein